MYEVNSSAEIPPKLKFMFFNSFAKLNEPFILNVKEIIIKMEFLISQ